MLHLKQRATYIELAQNITQYIYCNLNARHSLAILNTNKGTSPYLAGKGLVMQDQARPTTEVPHLVLYTRGYIFDQFYYLAVSNHMIKREQCMHP